MVLIVFFAMFYWVLRGILLHRLYTGEREFYVLMDGIRGMGGWEVVISFVRGIGNRNMKE